MATGSFRVKNGTITLTPLASPPSSPELGDVFVNSSGALNVYNGSAFVSPGGASILSTGDASIGGVIEGSRVIVGNVTITSALTFHGNLTVIGNIENLSGFDVTVNGDVFVSGYFISAALSANATLRVRGDLRVGDGSRIVTSGGTLSGTGVTTGPGQFNLNSPTGSVSSLASGTLITFTTGPNTGLVSTLQSSWFLGDIRVNTTPTLTTGATAWAATFSVTSTVFHGFDILTAATSTFSINVNVSGDLNCVRYSDVRGANAAGTGAPCGSLTVGGNINRVVPVAGVSQVVQMTSGVGGSGAGGAIGTAFISGNVHHDIIMSAEQGSLGSNSINLTVRGNVYGGLNCQSRTGAGAGTGTVTVNVTGVITGSVEVISGLSGAGTSGAATLKCGNLSGISVQVITGSSTTGSGIATLQVSGSVNIQSFLTVQTGNVSVSGPTGVPSIIVFGDIVAGNNVSIWVGSAPNSGFGANPIFRVSGSVQCTGFGVQRAGNPLATFNNGQFGSTGSGPTQAQFYIGGNLTICNFGNFSYIVGNGLNCPGLGCFEIGGNFIVDGDITFTLGGAAATGTTGLYWLKIHGSTEARGTFTFTEPGNAKHSFVSYSPGQSQYEIAFRGGLRAFRLNIASGAIPGTGPLYVFFGGFSEIGQLTMPSTVSSWAILPHCGAVSGPYPLLNVHAPVLRVDRFTGTKQTLNRGSDGLATAAQADAQSNNAVYTYSPNLNAWVRSTAGTSI